MRFRASSTYDFYRPSKCALRVAERYRRVPEAQRSPFMDLLARLGERHEKEHLAALDDVIDLSELGQEVRERETLAAIRAGAPAVYQGRFRASIEIGGEPCEIVGEPDFLIRSANGAGYFIRDSKLSLRINEQDHREIFLQLQVYGWLYNRNVQVPLAGLEVHSGSGTIVQIPYDGGAAALDFLHELRTMRLAPEGEYEPVGWSKCGGCGYFDRCWNRALTADDVSLLPTVSQALARKLHSRGVSSVHEVREAIEAPAFRDLFYEGKKKPRLRDSAVSLRRSVEAHVTGEDIPIAQPVLPASRSFAILDIEGIPPHLDELEKIYLWGMKVFGERPSGHLFAQAGFGSNGDQEGWFNFLGLVSRLFEDFGDLPFLHWHSYERTKLDLYIGRYGDPDGTARSLLDRLVDLHSVLRRSVVLPVPSYGLKVVEKYVGFTRRLSDADGAWAMCRYIEATEISDPDTRNEIMGQILAYNEEDLEATWAVMQWLKSLRPGHVESDS